MCAHAIFAAELLLSFSAGWLVLHLHSDARGGGRSGVDDRSVQVLSGMAAPQATPAADTPARIQRLDKVRLLLRFVEIVFGRLWLRVSAPIGAPLAD